MGYGRHQLLELEVSRSLARRARVSRTSRVCQPVEHQEGSLRRHCGDPQSGLSTSNITTKYCPSWCYLFGTVARSNFAKSSSPSVVSFEVIYLSEAEHSTFFIPFPAWLRRSDSTRLCDRISEPLGRPAELARARLHAFVRTVSAMKEDPILSHRTNKTHSQRASRRKGGSTQAATTHLHSHAFTLCLKLS